jgi:hypothetical protein
MMQQPSINKSWHQHYPTGGGRSVGIVHLQIKSHNGFFNDMSVVLDGRFSRLSVSWLDDMDLICG